MTRISASILSIMLLSMILRSASADDRVHFVLEAPHASSVIFASSVFSWRTEGERYKMKKDPGTGIWHYDIEIPMLPSIEYKFVVDGKWIHDPENPEKKPDGHGGFNSVYYNTGFTDDPGLKWSENVPHGKMTELMNRPPEFSRVFVYTPSGYDSSSKRYPTVYFNDGEDYIRHGIPALVDSMVHEGSMEPVIAVFTSPVDRTRDYVLNATYVAAIKRLVSIIDNKFRTVDSSRKRLIAGPSFGGLLSVYAHYLLPDVFSLVGSQSGAFWPRERRLLYLIRHSNVRNLKIYLTYGTFETDSISEPNLIMNDILTEGGAETRFTSYPSIHDWIFWRNNMRELLMFFFSR